MEIKCLVDTGATISILHPDKYYAIPKQNRPSLEPYTLKLRMGDGALIPTLGCAVIPLQWGLNRNYSLLVYEPYGMALYDHDL